MNFYTPLFKFIPNMKYHFFDYFIIQNKQENENATRILGQHGNFYWNFFSVSDTRIFWSFYYKALKKCQ